MKRIIENTGNKKIMIGKREIKFLNDQVKVSAPLSESTMQWSAISSLQESNKSYFLFLVKTI